MDQTTLKAAPAPAARMLPLAEFIPLMAALTAVSALSIDAMLPALGAIGQDLHLTTANDRQLVISSTFLGMAPGGLVSGALADRYGRRATILAGLAVFLLGSVLAAAAPTFPLLLAGRVLQGFGSAIPATASTALLRDLYSGAGMARVLSFVMATFILVPLIAPLLGQIALGLGGWRLIFALFVVLGFAVTAWFAWRQPETLPRANRIPLEWGRLRDAFVSVIASRPAMGYSAAVGVLFGAFLGYLSTSQQIYQDVYGVGAAFPLYFSSLALFAGAAFFISGSLVMRLGMLPLSLGAFSVLTVLAFVFLAITLAYGGVPPMGIFLAYMACTIFCFGLLMGNLNALAMEPFGRGAGMASAIVGTLRTLIGLPLGVIAGRAFDGTLVPLGVGYAVLGSVGLGLVFWARAGAAGRMTAPPATN